MEKFLEFSGQPAYLSSSRSVGERKFVKKKKLGGLEEPPWRMTSDPHIYVHRCTCTSPTKTYKMDKHREETISIKIFTSSLR